MELDHRKRQKAFTTCHIAKYKFAGASEQRSALATSSQIDTLARPTVGNVWHLACTARKSRNNIRNYLTQKATLQSQPAIAMR